MLNIALMGYGVIGSGVAKVIEENKKLYNDMVHFEISTLMIGNPRHTGKLTENPDFYAVPAEWVKAK